jgi:hypothetical protein
MNWAVNIAIDSMLEGHSPDEAKAAVNAARDRGTAVHAGVEAMIGGVDFVPGENTLPYWYGWAKFLLNEQPEILFTEQMVINLTVGYGGTIDLGCVLPKRGPKPVQIDIKTGEPKDSHALQLAAYASTEFMGAPDDAKKHDLPDFDSHYVLALSPDAPYYELVPLAVGPDEIEHFHFLAETYHRLKKWAGRDRPSLEVAA